MTVKEDVDRLKEEATYKKGWNDGAFFVGKKMLLVCSATISIATAGIYKAAYFIFENSEPIKAAWETWENYHGK